MFGWIWGGGVVCVVEVGLVVGVEVLGVGVVVGY